MSEEFSDERGRSIRELAQAALDFPRPKRQAFVQSRRTDPEIAKAPLELANPLDQHDEQPRLTAGTRIGHFVLSNNRTGGAYGERRSNSHNWRCCYNYASWRRQRKSQS